MVIGATTATLGFIKLWLFSHGDLSTIQIFASGQGLSGIAALWISTTIPLVVGFAAFFSATFLGEALREDDAFTPPLIAHVLSLTASFVLVPAKFALILAAYSAIQVGYGVIAKFWRRAARSRPKLKVPWPLQLSGIGRRRIDWRFYAAFAMAGALAMSLFIDTPWLPRERVSLKDDSAVVGYVAQGQPGFLIMIEEASRTPVAVPSGEIVKRDICGAPMWGGRSVLGQLMWGPPNPPPPWC
jgi:hypothetical protein